MNNDKKINLDSIGKANPFVVPEGYFQQLQADVMNRLPHDEQKVVAPVRRYSLRPIITAAASVCIAVFGYAAYLQFVSSESNNQDEAMIVANSDADLESSYIMMDNTSIYAYMSEY